MDGPVHDLTLPARHVDAMPSRRVTADGNDAVVYMGSEATVQKDLAFADCAALVEGAEIQKPHLDGLFDFESIRGRQEHPRDVSLPELDTGLE